jgi:hypothetical protein
MKLLFFSTTLLFILGSCNSQPTAHQQAITEKNAIEAARPGTVPAKESGWTMTAKINGKAWSASSLMPPEAAGRIIGYYKDAYIGLPYYRKQGEKTTFGESNAVDLSVSNDDNFYGGRTGSMEITKVNGGWIEGIFHFTATGKGSAKTFKVTDGFFRISLIGKP